MYDLEMEHLWRKTWLHACHISEIPNDGSYKLFEQVGLNVIVTRGPGDQVRAFHNICRHPGSSVVLEQTGTATRLVCPSPSWAYERDDALLSMPHSRPFPSRKQNGSQR